MKKLRWFLLLGYIFCMFMFIITSCGHKKLTPEQQSEQTRQDDKFYRDFDLKIVSINARSDYTSGKHPQPELCNVILFETTQYFEQRNNTEHLYRELIICGVDMDYNNSGCGCEKKIKINTEWLYNHKPGDLVHFDYMLKSKFFKINEK